MMECRELTTLVTEYLEGRLSWWDRIRFQIHLGVCAHCRVYLRQMRAVVRETGRLPSDAIPPGLEAELLRRFRNWK